MARVRHLDAQWATERAARRIPKRRPVGEQINDHHLLVMPAAEQHVEAAERREAALKVMDMAAAQHTCELDPDNGVTECTHPDHERDADWARVALDVLGLDDENLTQPDDGDQPVEPDRQKARLDRSKFPRPEWGWQDTAACRGEDLVLFFGPDGERAPEREIREEKAKRICWGCPVRTECLDYAVSRPEKYGTYGGLNEDERASERRRRQRRTNAA